MDHDVGDTFELYTPLGDFYWDQNQPARKYVCAYNSYVFVILGVWGQMRKTAFWSSAFYAVNIRRREYNMLIRVWQKMGCELDAAVGGVSLNINEYQT